MIEPVTAPEQLDPPSGQLLLVDKPLEWTSFDVVNKVRNAIRRAYGLKKIKVGHAGTLDPLATGLLLICTGPYTRRLQELTGLEKTYTGTFLLGRTTPSYDLETPFETDLPTSHITEDAVKGAFAALSGPQMQVPPLFSAKKVDGKKAYIAARKGQEMEIPPAAIEIYSFELTAFRLPEVDFEVRCSKGTYIRSLARDVGEHLGTGACLTSLRRTQTGGYDVKDAFGLDALCAHLDAKKATL